jgi:hypothetical protein
MLKTKSRARRLARARASWPLHARDAQRDMAGAGAWRGRPCGLLVRCANGRGAVLLESGRGSWVERGSIEETPEHPYAGIHTNRRVAGRLLASALAL